MKTSLKRRLTVLEKTMPPTDVCDLESAIRILALAEVFTLEELEMMEVELVPMSSEMEARLKSAIDVLSLELTGQSFESLSSVPLRIRVRAIQTLIGRDCFLKKLLLDRVRERERQNSRA